MIAWIRFTYVRLDDSPCASLRYSSTPLSVKRLNTSGGKFYLWNLQWQSCGKRALSPFLFAVRFLPFPYWSSQDLIPPATWLFTYHFGKSKFLLWRRAVLGARAGRRSGAPRILFDRRSWFSKRAQLPFTPALCSPGPGRGRRNQEGKLVRL